ncbi:F-box protein: endocytic membrane traffic, recycling ReCYcling 1 [Mortierella sp. NVP85]|nr:F-box protein: endocytic membrane traffic, recycling ReCYcling 1 [Mortierella sp. NVP85]
MEIVFDAADFDEERSSTDLITSTSIPALPSDLLLKCVQYLPISSLPAVARACRRLKVIVYSDELWETKLRAMGFGFGGATTGPGGSLLDGPSAPLLRFPVQGSNISEVTRKRISANNAEAVKGSIVQDGANGRISLSAFSEDGGRSSVESDVSIFSPTSKPRVQIPGLPGDPYAMIRGRKNHGSREQFKQIYTELWPYYVDFREANQDCRVIREFGKNVLDVARMLSRLLSFSKAPLTDDFEHINENLHGTCEYFENRCLHLFEVAYDSKNIPEMAKYAGVLLDLNGAQACIQIFIQKNGIFFDNNYEPGENLKQYEIWFSQPIVVRENTSFPEFTPTRLFMEFTEMEFKKQAVIIHEVFPEEADVLYTFTERVFEDVISEYCSQLFDLCSMRDKLLYLKSVPTAYRYLEHLENMLIKMEPIHVPQFRLEKLLARVFAPWLEQYLKQEQDWVQKSCKDQIDKYERQKESNKGESTRMNPRNREVFKRNFIKGFRNVLTLPYKISSSIVAATTSSSASSPGPSSTATPVLSPAPSSSSTLTISTSLSAPPKSNNRFSIRSITSFSGGSNSASSPTVTSAPETPTTVSSSTFIPDRKSFSVASDGDSVKSGHGGVDQVVTAQDVQEEMNSLLSVELALTLIHLDKDALLRLGAFAGLGGVLGGRVQKTIESVFIALLKSLGQSHIKVGFEAAIQQLSRYRPVTTHGSGVTPLMDFFELVHVADLILQMVQMYYAEEMCKHIDKMDFLNEANKEKKAFERMIDDGVAAGLDKSIEVLIGQVEYILATMQLPTDYNPDENTDIELQATRACREAITCLTTHTKMLVGCTDKHTLDVFFQELGLRLFNCLTKHLRSNIVSAQGGFVLICDLNRYYDFIVTLKQPMLTPNFLALKELGNIFIIQSPADLKQLIHDMQRFGGILRVEDVFEFAEMRSDWKTIQRIVERDRLECIVM